MEAMPAHHQHPPTRTRPLPRLLPALLVCLAVALVAGLAGPAPAARAGEEPAPVSATREAPDGGEDGTGRLVLVLDSSGSMAESAAGGGSKIQAAKDALGRVVDELPDEAEVGIRVFGSEVFDRSEPGACTDSRAVVPVGPLDRAALTGAVRDYEPYGETPIGHALREAGRDLGPAEDGVARTIVLLSDGEPTCEPDPCEVAAQLADQGIDLTINVVGLDVSGRAREALRCIARRGNGTYYDASSAEELSSSLVKVSVREMRRFRLDGERVLGGETVEDPLPLQPGTYVDTSRGDDLVRTYLVEKPVDGGLTASVLVRPRKDDENWHTAIHLKLLTPEGAECENSIAQEFQILGLTPISAAGIEHHQLSRGWRQEECLAADRLVLSVQLTSEPSDYLLRVGTHGEIDNLALLPGPLDAPDEEWVDVVDLPRSGERVPVVGGVHFADAPALEPGTTYADTLRPSEQLVYRVPAEYGQAVRLSARVRPDARAADRLGFQGNPVRLWAHTALWQAVPAVAGHPEVRGNSMYSGREPVVLTAVVPPLRLANGEAPLWRHQTATRGGDQVFVLGMGALDEDRDFAVPVELRAEVLGDVEGVPEYTEGEQGPGLEATQTPSGEASATGPEEDEDDDGAGATVGSDPDLLPWGVAVGAVLLLLVVGGLLVRRSRRASGPA
ncbi:vWA domain-containing protein [Nocardioides solisilvae]|uniref:vWA domain-containing protein n=1 Tax=Nocardioides solisilvae TaxID=1542435 RepID=UPI000D74A0B8|nr:VWA domain-containing protein [Nocardioides solisilvae]